MKIKNFTLGATVTCQHCGEDIRFIDGEWLDRETHSTCDRLDLPDRKHGPINQSEQGYIVAAITAIVREADQTFQTVGGSSRHWVRDCFLPILNRSGWYLCPTTPTAEPPSTNAVGQRPDNPTCVRAPESERSEVLPAGRLVDPSPSDTVEHCESRRPDGDGHVSAVRNVGSHCGAGFESRPTLSKSQSTQPYCPTCGQAIGGRGLLLAEIERLQAARVDPSPRAQLSETKDDQARGGTKADV